jgi:hypothetical protein
MTRLYSPETHQFKSNLDLDFRTGFPDWFWALFGLFRGLVEVSGKGKIGV